MTVVSGNTADIIDGVIVLCIFLCINSCSDVVSSHVELVIE